MNSEVYVLTEEQISSYEQNGHILLKNVATQEEVSFFRTAIKNALRKYFDERTLLQKDGKVDDYNTYFTQVTNLWQKNETVKQFVFMKKFASVAAQLMRVKGVRLYHDQGLFKEPGGKPTPWHQDQYYWPIKSNNTITMWMPLVDAEINMGTMKFASGSHKFNHFNDKPISTETDSYYSDLIKQYNLPISSDSLKAGDATFHSGWTIHSTSGNNTQTTREVMTVIYYEDGVEISEPDNKHRQVDMEAFFPGQKPGEKAASVLNPLLYEK